MYISVTAHDENGRATFSKTSSPDQPIPLHPFRGLTVSRFSIYAYPESRQDIADLIDLLTTLADNFPKPEDEGATVTVTGLPEGFSYDADKGAISGKPESGKHPGFFYETLIGEWGKLGGIKTEWDGAKIAEGGVLGGDSEEAARRLKKFYGRASQATSALYNEEFVERYFDFIRSFSSPPKKENSDKGCDCAERNKAAEAGDNTLGCHRCPEKEEEKTSAPEPLPTMDDVIRGLYSLLGSSSNAQQLQILQQLQYALEAKDRMERERNPFMRSGLSQVWSPAPNTGWACAADPFEGDPSTKQGAKIVYRKAQGDKSQ